MLRVRLQTTKFENLRMKEYETIEHFYVCVHDIANNSFALAENMSEEKLARKFLRYFSKRFDMKLIAIEEAQDISSIKVDELIGSFLAFKMAINEKNEKKRKGVSFKVDIEDD